MTTQNKLLIILLSQYIIGISIVQGKILDDRAFMDAIREHKAQGTQRDFDEDFRSKVSQDENGNLVKEISGDPDLNSTIFYHLDAVPNKHIEIVLSSWLEDNNQWGSRGGMYYSPSTQIVQALRVYIRPESAVDPPSIVNMYYVLEDERSRQRIAKALRESHSEEDLHPVERTLRRSQAWGEIVKIVEDVFPRLIEDDKERRARAAMEPNPRAGMFLDEIQANSAGSSLQRKNHDESDSKKYHLIWYLFTVLASIVVAVLFFWKRITKA